MNNNIIEVECTIRRKFTIHRANLNNHPVKQQFDTWDSASDRQKAQHIAEYNMRDYLDWHGNRDTISIQTVIIEEEDTKL